MFHAKHSIKAGTHSRRRFCGVARRNGAGQELARNHYVEITLINRDNFFLFTPMLHEVAASDLDLTTIVNPVRRMLQHVRFFAGEVEKIDLGERAIIVSHGFDRHRHTLPFDFLVLGLGSVTNLYRIPGLEEYALTMKSLGDAMRLGNYRL